MVDIEDAPSAPKETVRDNFGGYEVGYAVSQDTPLVKVAGSATGVQTMSADEARETAQALRDGGEALNRLFDSKEVPELADALEEAADRLEEDHEQYREEVEQFKQKWVEDN